MREKAGEGASGAAPNKGRKERKMDRNPGQECLRTAPEGTAAGALGPLGTVQPQRQSALPALRLAGGSLGHPGAHLLAAWGLLPQSTRAPPCGATAPAWKTDLRPEEDVLTNGSGSMHLLATVDIGQRTSHLPSYSTFCYWSPYLPIRY